MGLDGLDQCIFIEATKQYLAMTYSTKNPDAQELAQKLCISLAIRYIRYNYI